MTKPRRFILATVALAAVAVFARAHAGGAPAQAGNGRQPQRAAQPQMSAQEGLDRMGVVGYADRMTAQAGDTVRFMVSTRSTRYHADIVRLIHGDANPRGPGFKEMVVDTPANGDYSGKRQAL